MWTGVLFLPVVLGTLSLSQGTKSLSQLRPRTLVLKQCDFSAAERSEKIVFRKGTLIKSVANEPFQILHSVCLLPSKIVPLDTNFEKLQESFIPPPWKKENSVFRKFKDLIPSKLKSNEKQISFSCYAGIHDPQSESEFIETFLHSKPPSLILTDGKVSATQSRYWRFLYKELNSIRFEEQARKKFSEQIGKDDSLARYFQQRQTLFFHQDIKSPVFQENSHSSSEFSQDKILVPFMRKEHDNPLIRAGSRLISRKKESRPFELITFDHLGHTFKSAIGENPSFEAPESFSFVPHPIKDSDHLSCDSVMECIAEQYAFFFSRLAARNYIGELKFMILGLGPFKAFQRLNFSILKIPFLLLKRSSLKDSIYEQDCFAYANQNINYIFKTVVEIATGENFLFFLKEVEKLLPDCVLSVANCDFNLVHSSILPHLLARNWEKDSFDKICLSAKTIWNNSENNDRMKFQFTSFLMRNHIYLTRSHTIGMPKTTILDAQFESLLRERFDQTQLVIRFLRSHWQTIQNIVEKPINFKPNSMFANFQVSIFTIPFFLTESEKQLTLSKSNYFLTIIDRWYEGTFMVTPAEIALFLQENRVLKQYPNDLDHLNKMLKDRLKLYAHIDEFDVGSFQSLQKDLLRKIFSSRIEPEFSKANETTDLIWPQLRLSCEFTAEFIQELQDYIVQNRDIMDPNFKAELESKIEEFLVQNSSLRQPDFDSSIPSWRQSEQKTNSLEISKQRIKLFRNYIQMMALDRTNSISKYLNFDPESYISNSFASHKVPIDCKVEGKTDAAMESANQFHYNSPHTVKRENFSQFRSTRLPANPEIVTSRRTSLRASIRQLSSAAIPTKAKTLFRSLSLKREK